MGGLRINYAASTELGLRKGVVECVHPQKLQAAAVGLCRQAYSELPASQGTELPMYVRSRRLR